MTIKLRDPLNRSSHGIADGRDLIAGTKKGYKFEILERDSRIFEPYFVM